MNMNWEFDYLEVEYIWNKINIDSLAKIKIAYLDTGCDISHKFFRNNKITALSVSDDINLEDEIGHGTFFAGVVSKLTNVHGKVGPEILSIKIGNTGQFSIKNVNKGIQIAIDNKADILNIGACNAYYSPEMARLINQAIESGIIVICPSGNYIFEEYTYPSSLETVISCASSDINGNLAEHSNFHEFVDVLAPGVDILGPLSEKQAKRLGIETNECGLAKMSGTSFASAILSSLAVLLKSSFSLNQWHFKYLLENAFAKSYSYVMQNGTKIKKPIINFREALQWIKNSGFENYTPDILQRNYLNLKVPVDFMLNKQWEAQTYDSKGNFVEINMEDLTVEVYKFQSDQKLQKEKIDVRKVNIKNGSLFWEFDVNNPGVYKIKIISKGNINGAMSMAIVKPNPPKLSYAEKKGDKVNIKFEDVEDNVEIYYSIINDRLVVDPMKGPLRGTQRYIGVFDVPNNCDCLFAATFANGIFSEIVRFELK